MSCPCSPRVLFFARNVCKTELKPRSVTRPRHPFSIAPHPWAIPIKLELIQYLFFPSNLCKLEYSFWISFILRLGFLLFRLYSHHVWYVSSIYMYFLQNTRALLNYKAWNNLHIPMPLAHTIVITISSWCVSMSTLHCFFLRGLGFLFSCCVHPLWMYIWCLVTWFQNIKFLMLFFLLIVWSWG